MAPHALRGHLVHPAARGFDRRAQREAAGGAYEGAALVDGGEVQAALAAASFADLDANQDGVVTRQAREKAGSVS